MGDGALDHLADPVDALILLLGRLAQFAVGGFLCGVIIPLPTYPLSPIHPEGSIPSSSPEGAWGGHIVHGPRIGAPGAHTNLPSGRTRIRVVHARASVLDRPQIAAVALVQAGDEGAVHHDSRSHRAPPPR